MAGGSHRGSFVWFAIVRISGYVTLQTEAPDLSPIQAPMKKIVRYCLQFWKEEFHAGLYLTLGVFLALAIWANYEFGIKKILIDSRNKELTQIPAYLLFYGFPYLFALFAWAYCTSNWSRLRQTGFWGYLLFALLLLSVKSWFYYHQPLAILLFLQPAWIWGTELLWNMKSSLFYLVPLLGFWWIVDRKTMPSFYGLTKKNFEATPYFIILLAVAPLIVIASLQPDFMRSYPQYVPGSMEEALGWSPWVSTGLLQLFYGLDFTFVELFFRGFVVIGMARWLGPGAILPMVAVYCFLHFGKPAGEAIASVFGGYLLGIFVFYSRSILGGVILHWGVAWLMECSAYAQILFSSD